MQKDLRSRDVIKMFGISKQTLYNWRKAGLPFSGSGQTLLYDEAKIRYWLDNRDNSEKVEEVIKSNYPDKK
ncbi:MAG: helix-turn-helix domain-containing protein [Planctomycetia bacterium]|nr:helix-turn-helix domain-containing protein [Planctomycetia bacterium]